MAETVLYVGTYGSEDSTRATLTFAAAIRMKGKSADSRVIVALLGKGIELIQGDTAKKMKVAGKRPAYATVDDMMKAALAAGVEIHC